MKLFWDLVVLNMSESRLYKTEIFSAIVLGASTRKCIQNRIKTNYKLY